MSIIRAAQLELTEQDLARVSATFGVGPLAPLGGFENALFRSTDGRVVRLTHTSRRSVPMIQAEFAFMEHLAIRGVPVVGPVRSSSDRLAEEIVTDAGDTVVVACMTEAAGDRRWPPAWSPADIEAYGELLGTLHTAATDFAATPPTRRPDWTDPIFDVGLGAAVGEDALQQRYREIIDAGRSHPAGATGLLIHQDAHLGNLFITDRGEITLFDFDDCAYGTATHDLGIVLFYWVLGHEDPPGEARRFLGHFVAGYERRADLPDHWPLGADLFLSYREIDIYWLIHTEDPADSSAAELRFMDRRRERILDGVPYLGVPLADVV